VTDPAGDSSDVIVVGGGICGLTAAWRLMRAGARVRLLEEQDTVGGCIRTEQRDGCLLEKGPFNVLVRDDVFHELLDACADEIEPIRASDEAGARFVLKNGRLHRVPTGPGALVKSPLLSTGAKLHMLIGTLLSPRARQDDPTIAQVAQRRLGAEVADTFISALVAGIFGGDSDKLSLKACFPSVWQFDRSKRSPLIYEVGVLRRKKREALEHPERQSRKGLISFREGLGSLPAWLGRQCGDDLVTNCRVESIKSHDGRFIVRAHDVVTGVSRELSAGHLLVATPASVTADLLRSVCPTAASELGSIPTASLVVLNLVYRATDVGHPMRGYGFLVPGSERGMPVMGVLWADSAFPHHSTPDQRIIRVFLGGTRDPEAVSRSDDELLQISSNALRDLLQIRGEPERADICRWPNSIPQYHCGHTELIERVERELESTPNLHLVGSYLRGVSINDCVRQGIEIGDRIAGMIQATHTAGFGVSTHEAQRPAEAPA